MVNRNRPKLTLTPDPLLMAALQDVAGKLGIDNRSRAIDEAIRVALPTLRRRAAELNKGQDQEATKG